MTFVSGWFIENAFYYDNFEVCILGIYVYRRLMEECAA